MPPKFRGEPHGEPQWQERAELDPDLLDTVVPDQPARAKDQPPKVERLATSYFQRLWDGTPLKADEDVVRMTLDPLWPIGDLREDINAWRATVALTRTSTVFVLDQEDVDMVMESMRADSAAPDDDPASDEMRLVSGIGEEAGASPFEEGAEEAVERRQAARDELAGGSVSVDDADAHPYDFIDLPPLPYPRMAIEVTTPQGYPAAIYASKPAGQGGNHPLMLVNETEAGAVWDVFFPSVEPRGESELWNFRIASGGKFSIPATSLRPDNPDGRVIDPKTVDEKSSPRAARFWRRLTLDLVSLILAENVPHDAVPVPRQHRRGVERQINGKKGAGGYRFPKVYWVRLEHGGEGQREETGRGYSVRFLVRGHWRQYREGEVFTGGKKRVYSGKKVWVRPYIKGPVGAPWKGRPVYRGNATERVSEHADAKHVQA